MTLQLDQVALTIAGRPLVKQVSLNLEPGEVVGLLGPNGAGKTTTFNLVTGLLRPDSGDVVMNGHSIAELSMPLRARLGIGYLPQEASVFRNLNVRDNLLLALQESGLPAGERRQRAERLIEDFHLSAFAHRRGFQLSGGERRRCEVARALAVGAQGPRYLLLDEPFGALDAITKEELQEELLKIWNTQKCTVLMITHDIDEALLLAQEVHILAPSPGRIVRSLQVDFDRSDLDQLRLSTPFLRLRHEVANCLRQLSREPI